MSRKKKPFLPELPADLDPDDPFAGIEVDFGPPPPQVCTVCERPRPLEMFGKIGESGHRTICKECEKRAPALKDEEWKQERLRQGLHRLVMASRGNSAKCPDLDEVCGEMVKLFGGADEFAKRWFDAIQAAATKNPGSKTHLDQFYAIMKMIGAAQEGRREKEDLEQATEEQLEEAIASYVLNVYRPDDEESDSSHEGNASVA
jgi:hypothetical protein